MENLQTNKVAFENYKLTISWSSYRLKNFKNEVIDSTPVFSTYIDSSRFDEEKLSKLNDWSRSFWSHKDKEGVSNSSKYQDELKRAIYDVTTDIHSKWHEYFDKGVDKELKKNKKSK